MGKLLEQSIKTLYQGVSRQPDPVRLPGQVEEAENVLFSIVTGGFETRPASTNIRALAHISASDNPAIHAYSRDAIERYMITINSGDLKVFDLAGIEKTVSFPNGKSYLSATNERESFSFQTISDFTIIANSTVNVAMTASSYSPTYRALINCRTTNSNTTYTIQINGSTVWTLAVSNALSNTQVADSINSTLSLPSGFSKTRLGETIVITGPSSFTVGETGSDSIYGPRIMADIVEDRKFLPKDAPDGYYIKVGSNLDGELFGYWAKYVTADGGWKEAADPAANNAFNVSTMPHWLVRNADGTFTFKVGIYPDRIAGDVDTVPDPDFVGAGIQALTFHRNRLAFVSGETVFFSQSKKYFTFWPDFSTQVLDSDAFGLTASSTTVNTLKHVTGFRKSLFLTSNKAQFEVSGDKVLSPSTGTIDLATSYLTEEICAPKTLGNKLYFAAKSGNDAVLFEYLYDDNSVSNYAADITLHALGYVPAPLTMIAADTTNEMLMLSTSAEPNALYIYKAYMDGETKAQSAWSKWTYGTGSIIKWMEVIDGELYMVLSRNGAVYFEKTFLRYELSSVNHPYQVAMDRLNYPTGTYSASTGLTTWTTPYPHNDKASVVLSNLFPSGRRGEVLPVLYPTTTTVTAFGDFTSAYVILGETITSSVTLSKLYPRDAANPRSTMTGGRFQLRNISFNFKETGFFYVEITPKSRSAITYSYGGRTIGAASNLVGTATIETLGNYKVAVSSDASTCGIRVYNNTEKPMNITSIDYVGFYNEITVQG